MLRLTKNQMTKVRIMLRRVMMASVPHTTGRGIANGSVVVNTIITTMHINRTHVGPSVDLMKKKWEMSALCSIFAICDEKNSLKLL